MRITDTMPHRVVELLPAGAAARSNKVQLQDCLIAVNDLKVHEVNDIGLIRSHLVGAKGSTVVLQFERHKHKNDEERIITVSLVRS
jgi:C-terminal processing protease CtpA/Prc